MNIIQSIVSWELSKDWEISADPRQPILLLFLLLSIGLIRGLGFDVALHHWHFDSASGLFLERLDRNHKTGDG